MADLESGLEVRGEAKAVGTHKFIVFPSLQIKF